MFALGTSDGLIKLFNLKGYEQEIDQAHFAAVIWVQFVPNQGIMVSVDIQNNFKVWQLSDMSLKFDGEIPVQDISNTVTCLYIPPELTNQPLNHKHTFVGMKNGEVLIFDHSECKWASFRIEGKKIFPKATRSLLVTDIKC